MIKRRKLNLRRPRSRKRQPLPQPEMLHVASVPDERAVNTPDERAVNINGTPVTAREVLSSLIESRNITTPFSKALAVSVVNAVCSGDLANAVKALAMLPPVTRGEVSATTMSAEHARERLLELVLNACAADQFEAEQVEKREVAALKAEVAELRRRLGEPSNDQAAKRDYSHVLTVPGDAPKTITPSLGDIVPPREQSDNPQNMRPPKYDSPKPAPPVIDATPVPTAPPSPTVPGQWDQSPSGQAWHEWRRNNPDGYGGGGIL
jgi:hypothetical protein